MKTLEELRSAVTVAQEAVKAEEQRLQSACVHPLASLSITYSGVSSYYGGTHKHGMTFRCSSCEKTFRDQNLVIHDD